MFDSFSTALSALKANATALSVTGNNLANMNTTGYKSVSTSFHDVVSQTSGNGLEGLEVGAGVGRPSTSRDFDQGSINVTGGHLDASIQGQGFFVVSDSAGQTLYTRAGDFSLDADGNLLTRTGENVQGWNAVDGVLNANGAVSNIVVPAGGLLPPSATTEMSFTMNLDASAEIDDVFSAPIAVVDSLGQSHVLTVEFTKTSATEWTYDVTIPGSEVSGGTAGTPESLLTGTLTFSDTGLLVTPDADAGPLTVDITGLSSGAADMSVDWSLFDSSGGVMLTHYSEPSALSALTQNGFPAAELISISFQDGGSIVAQYTNGVQKAVAQVAIANIANPDSMVSAGNNNLQVTAGSATPSVGPAGTGGRGSIIAGALESSTVDIAEEFTNLIQYQRSYQANSRVITTIDEISQETLNLKR